MKFPGKKWVAIAAFENLPAHTHWPVLFLVFWAGTRWILLCGFALKPAQCGSCWLPRGLISGVKFTPSFQFLTAFPCFWVLVPQGESRLSLKTFFFLFFFLSPSRFYWCWLGAVVGASMCWACFTPNLPNEGGVSALEPPFHYDGFEFHCVICFLLVQVQTAASCTESLLLPVVHLL